MPVLNHKSEPLANVKTAFLKDFETMFHVVQAGLKRQGRAQEHFLCKHTGLSTNPKHLREKLDVTACICDPSVTKSDKKAFGA